MNPRRCPARQLGFGPPPHLLIGAVLVAATLYGLGAALLDASPVTFGERLLRHGPVFLGIALALGLLFGGAWAWDTLVDYRKWRRGPPSALRVLRNWHDAPARRPAGGPLAALAALDDLRVHASVDGETALHWALNPAVQASLDSTLEAVVDKLLAAGADANARNSLGNTPLHIAVKSQAARPVIERLLAAGADPLLADSLGTTALDAAKAWDAGRGIEPLLRAAAGRNGQAAGGRTT